MFGGCLIKPIDGQKGFIGDANINEWSNTVRKAKAAYPNLQNIIPEHGEYGDASLLDYILTLFNNKTDDQFQNKIEH